MNRNGQLSPELEEKVKQVEMDNNCNCTEREVPLDELDRDVAMINPDDATLDRG